MQDGGDFDPVFAALGPFYAAPKKAGPVCDAFWFAMKFWSDLSRKVDQMGRVQASNKVSGGWIVASPAKRRQKRFNDKLRTAGGLCDSGIRD